LVRSILHPKPFYVSEFVEIRENSARPEERGRADIYSDVG
jgi:hypothetical protein